MRFPLSRKRSFEIEPLTLDDSAAVARIHAECFSRPWSSGEFRALLTQPPVFGFIANDDRSQQAPPGGFVLARLAAGEAEILTIAVSPRERRSGLGWRLMGAVIRHLRLEQAESLFLEVDETNVAAVTLYRRLGFEVVATRHAYYENQGRPKTAALVMRRDFS